MKDIFGNVENLEIGDSILVANWNNWNNYEKAGENEKNFQIYFLSHNFYLSL